jgi:hypothetical protein
MLHVSGARKRCGHGGASPVAFEQTQARVDAHEDSVNEENAYGRQSESIQCGYHAGVLNGSPTRCTPHSAWQTGYSEACETQRFRAQASAGSSHQLQRREKIVVLAVATQNEFGTRGFQFPVRCPISTDCDGRAVLTLRQSAYTCVSPVRRASCFARCSPCH